MKMSIYFLLFASLVYTSCQVDDEFEGPSLVDLYGEFTLVTPLDITNRDVNFSTGESTTFIAAFSKNVDWTVEV
jgi:hypothetical protein